MTGVASAIASGGFALDDRALKKVMREFPDEFAHNAKVAVRQTFSTFRRKFISGEAGVKLRRGKSGLARQWFWDVTGGKSAADVEGIFFTESKVALVHEEGANIRPTGGRKWLAIPAGFSVGQNGRPKKPMRSAGRYIRKKGRDKFRIEETRRGGLSIFEIVGRLRKHQVGRKTGPLIGKQRLRLVYHLVASLVIKPKLGLFRTWRKIGEQETEKRMTKALDFALRGKRLPGSDPRSRKRR